MVVSDVLKSESLIEAVTDCNILLNSTGVRSNFDTTGPYQIDYQRIKNLVNLAKDYEIKQFVFVYSLSVFNFVHLLNFF
ncbi:MAG: hypothetical protein KPI85_07495 [cyanobacterium endosymbiont of Epithemia adnata isolate EadnSB Bon19]